jgi:hypothetical protein
MKAIVLGLLLVTALCWAKDEPADMAWVSLDASGTPVLTELDVEEDSDLILHFFLKPERDTVHAFMFPLCYDPGLEVVKMEFHEPTFSPQSWCEPMWNYFPNTDPESHRLMFYAWTATYACGLPTDQALHVGSVTFKVLDEPKSEMLFDTCAFPPRCHLSVTNGPKAIDHWPDWQPVKVKVESEEE